MKLRRGHGCEGSGRGGGIETGGGATFNWTHSQGPSKEVAAELKPGRPEGASVTDTKAGDLCGSQRLTVSWNL